MVASVIQGHCLDTLSYLPDRCVHACVTSPPYFGLRSYLPDDHPDKHLEIGSEKTPAEWVAKLVAVFAEVRRVLRDDGTLWLNCGDAYAARWSSVREDSRRGFSEADRTRNGEPPDGYKPGDRLMLATMLAEALRADGWWLRDAIVWQKTAPMPESVSGWRWEKHRIKLGKDDQGQTIWMDCTGCKKCQANDGLILRKGSWRHTSSYEWVFHFAKSAKYYGDGEATREKDLETDHKHRNILNGQPSLEPSGGLRSSHSKLRLVGGRSGTGRNPRNVWTLGPDPFPEAHFAVFPRELPRRAILASTSAKGVCPSCGAPWVRVTERSFVPQGDVSLQLGVRGHNGQKPMAAESGWQGFPRGSTTAKTHGWRPSCTCAASRFVPATILDPFGGAGTTGVVADELGRDAILLELSEAYALMAERRIETAAAKSSASLRHSRTPATPSGSFWTRAASASTAAWAEKE